MKARAWTHQTPNGDVVSKTKLTYDSEPLYTLSQVTELLEAEAHDRKSSMYLTQGVALQFAADWIREMEGA